jgi:hypothetical protein
VRFLDVGTESFISPSTYVTDYISSVIVFDLAEWWQRIISSTLVIVVITSLATFFWVNLAIDWFATF